MGQLRPVRIRMHRNPLRCDCRLEWLVEKLRLQQLHFAGICASPASLRQLPVNELIRPHLGGCSGTNTEVVRAEEADNQLSAAAARSAERTDEHGGPVELFAVIGAPKLIYCGAASRAGVRWQKDFAELRLEQATQLPNGSLWIAKAMPEHTGVYTCKSVELQRYGKFRLQVLGEFHIFFY